MLGPAARDPDPGAGVITVTAPSMGASRQSRDPAPGRRDSSTTGQEIMNDSGSIPRERGVAGGRAAHASPDGAPGDAAAAPPPFHDFCFHDFSATTIEGQPRSMSQYRGQLVLVVNTATRCAFTPQLEGLQGLHAAYQQHGFTVLGFPSDQFHQDPGTDQDTEQFCTSAYDTTFPLFSKVDVNGPAAHPLWIWLREQKGGGLGGRIAWNFTKLLIDGQGRVLRRSAPPVPPARIAGLAAHGPAARPLGGWLGEQRGGVLGGRIAWNCSKCRVDGQGRVLRRYAPPVPPARIARRIEHELGLRPGGHGAPA